MQNKKILLVISGGIAAYKSLELIRLLKKDGADVTCILTEGGKQFVTPMSVSALSENHVFTDLWSLKDEREMGHIQLSREADLIIVAPASANTMARAANGMADDLASTTLLASDKPIIYVPAMNHKMWEHPATQRNIKTLQADGAHIIFPDKGDMACGEYGTGRMQEPEAILKALRNASATMNAVAKTNDQDLQEESILQGKHVLITAGPTYEPIDPVRFIGNRSSGKQGFAIAEQLTKQGARVTLIAGPTSLETPQNVTRIDVDTADQMLTACQQALPADVGIFSAAVGDWTPEEPSATKIKKKDHGNALQINFRENPDVVHTIATAENRPALIIGFAAETHNLVENAAQKLTTKNCDWILANPVTQIGGESVFGADTNHVHFISKDKTEDWSLLSKNDVAIKLTNKIAKTLNKNKDNTQDACILAAE
jgi:phosphopantothenoylcysteine decarboxylase/phosphopantothenate--cysteine ligase